MHRISLTRSLTDTAAAEHRTQQYFETVGNRSMYKDGWWLAVKTERIPWVFTPEAIRPYAPDTWDPDLDPAGIELASADEPEKALGPFAEPPGTGAGQVKNVPRV